jgi:signal transduction histidine kinase
LELQLAESLPTVLADAVVLRRIVENLVDNAVDALESRPGRVTIATTLVEGGQEVTRVSLTVTDTGRGLSEEQQARIFDDFYTTKPEGTGLGLSIVRRLVMDLMGTVQVRSEEGRGSRFIIELPASDRTTVPAPAGEKGETQR